MGTKSLEASPGPYWVVAGHPLQGWISGECPFLCVLFFLCIPGFDKNAVFLSLRIVPPIQATRWPLTPNTRLASKSGL